MKRSYLRGAAVLAAGALAAKFLGALYRIPLANALGGYGMGLYQMAYPLFTLLLTFTSAGIPSALSRAVAGERARGAGSGASARAAALLFGGLGLLGTAAMLVFARPMASLQGEQNLRLCYFMLAPAVCLVALLAVFRGYFQGRGDMAPTAVSELTEQVVKAGIGLFFAHRFQFAPATAAAYALLGVTASEAAALLVLYIRYRLEKQRPVCLIRRARPLSLLSAVLPVMAAGAVLPLSRMLDCVLVPRLLALRSADAVSEFGLYSGGAVALYSLPATAAYGLAAAAVPEVSAAKNVEEGRARALSALLVTLAVTLPCAIGLMAFARPVVGILYPGLSSSDAALLVKLVRMTAISSVTLSGVETLAACLTGMGRAKYAALSMLAAVIVKTLVQAVLVSRPRFGIGGAAIAADLCFLIAFFLDLYYTVRKPKEKAYDHGRKSRSRARGADAEGVQRTQGGRRGARPHGGRPTLKDA